MYVVWFGGDLAGDLVRRLGFESGFPSFNTANAYNHTHTAKPTPALEYRKSECSLSSKFLGKIPNWKSQVLGSHRS